VLNRPACFCSRWNPICTLCKGYCMQRQDSNGVHDTAFLSRGYCPGPLRASL